MRDGIIIKARMILTDPIGFFQKLADDDRTDRSLRDFQRPILFLATFLLIYCVAIPAWIMINNWILGISV